MSWSTISRENNMPIIKVNCKHLKGTTCTLVNEDINRFLGLFEPTCVLLKIRAIITVTCKYQELKYERPNRPPFKQHNT